MLHQGGRLGEAEEAYRQVLQADPGNPHALHLIGVIAHRLGRNQRAVELTVEALRHVPSTPEFLNSLSSAYRGMGMPHEALASFEQSLAIAPAYVDALSNRGNVLNELGRPLEDLDSCQRALEVSPAHLITPKNLGSSLHKLGRDVEAIASFDQALAIDPAYVEALNHRGISLRALGRSEEALDCLERALKIEPGSLEALTNRGNALLDLRRPGEALESYDRVLALRPDHEAAISNRGNALRELRRYEEAAASFERALSVSPGNAVAAYNRGVVPMELGRLSAAEQSYRQALAIQPDYVEARSLWVNERQHLCLWSGLDQETALLQRLVSEEQTGRISPFHFLAQHESAAAKQRDCARQFAQTTLHKFLEMAPLTTGSAIRREGRLRIGYVSADLREHAVAYLVAEIIELQDRARFEIFGYSYGLDDRSAMRARLSGAFDHFRDIRDFSDKAAAQRIVEDGIDILVDLTGYTTGTRLEIAAQRPAPVQVSWLGYPGTLGHPRLADYVIGDPIVTPLAHAADLSETFAQMPHCYQPNDRHRRVGVRPSTEPAGLPAAGFVFCSFNQSYKFTPGVFDLWCRLLDEVPGSCLWLLETGQATHENLRAEALTRGVAPERIVFAPRKPLPEHLARLQLADLALDTFPYASHTTASDALWVGVPLVTRIGETFASRVAASILSAAGVPELVTRSPDEYFELALSLAKNPERLGKFGARLIETRATCPLFDSARFAKDLDRLYERILEDHLAGRREHISFL